MAQLVQIICVNHNPVLSRMLNEPGGDAGMEQARIHWQAMGEKLARSRPDVLLVVATDHLNQWFMDNMPAFMIGKAPTVAGPFPHEIRNWGMPHYAAPSDPEFAGQLLAAGLRDGIDFAYSNEFTLDHAFTVPLSLLRPQADIPVVPLFVNVMAPPIPSAARCFDVGMLLRRMIAECPSPARVCALYSGHLAIEIGGPRMRNALVGMGSPDPAFDERMTQLVADADVEGLLREATFERMSAAGNVGGTGFLPFVIAVGMADHQRPTFAVQIQTKMAGQPFYTWDLHAEAAQ